MIVDLAFFLAAVLVLTAPITVLNPVTGYALVTQVLAAVGLRWGNRYYARWVLVLLVLLAMSAATVVWSQSADVAIGSLLLLLAFVLFLLGSAWSSYASLLSAIAVVLPIVGVIQQWNAAWMGGEAIDGARLTLTTLVAWPLIALMAHGRYWVAAACFGVIGCVSGMHAIIELVDERSASAMSAIMIGGWRYSDPWLLGGQLVLTLIAVMPLMMESTRAWRTLTVVGIVLSGLPPILALLAGPWPSAWPVVVWLCVIPGILSVLTGGVGMLCTVRRPDLLATTAIRALGLGVGAAAVLLLPHAVQVPSEGLLVREMSRAIAPLVWGVLQAAVLAVAAVVAQQRDAPVLVTDRIVRSRKQAALELSQSFSGYMVDVLRSFQKDASSWISPSAVVPLLIFASAATAWQLCSIWHGLLIAGVLISLFLAELAGKHLILWSLLQAVLLTVCLWTLGATWPIIVGLVGLGMLLECLFLSRTPDYVAWALPASLGLVTLLWLPWAGVRPEPVLIAVGQMLLFANALLHGPVRWVAMPSAALIGLGFLWWRAPQLDRYVTSVYETLSPVDLLLTSIWRTPLLLLLLLVLLTSRRQARYGTVSLETRWRGVVYTVTTVAAGAWAMGYRPDWMMGVLLGGLVGAFACYLARKVAAGDASDLRWPMLDGAGLMLAAILVAVAQVGITYDVHQAQDEALAGALGEPVLQAVRDMVGIALAMVLVLLLQHWPRLLELAVLWYRKRVLPLLGNDGPTHH